MGGDYVPCVQDAPKGEASEVNWERDPESIMLCLTEPLPPFPKCICAVCERLREKGERGFPEDHPHKTTSLPLGEERGTSCVVMKNDVASLPRNDEGRTKLQQLAKNTGIDYHIVTSGATLLREPHKIPPNDSAWKSLAFHVTGVPVP